MAGLAVAAALVPGATGAAQPAHFNGRLAFASLGTVIVMNPDGSGMWPTRTTGIGWVDSWSPDGTKLLVEAENDLFAVDPDGGNRTRLTSSSAYDGQAVYSPDGSRIAFMSTRDGPARIWVMNADGSDPHTITSNFPGSGRPTWSPDGGQIAFTTGYSSVWITSSEGVGARHLVGSDVEPAFEPAWSPDGQTIVVSQRRQGNAEIFAVDVQTGAERRLTSSDGDDFDPVWSPDGTRIAFESIRTGRAEIFTMAADGSDVRQVTFTGGLAGPPAWQPLGPPPAGFCTIWGTEENDLLVGTAGDDGICGEGGNDRIIGGEGRDALNGDDGNDTIVAGPGFDIVNGGSGDDTIDSRDGERDFVNGWQGTDIVLADRRLDGTSEMERRLFPEPDNLARGRPVRASMALPTGPAAWAVDGHRVGFWSSLYAPQWVEIDLGKPQSIGRVSLAVAQTPDGKTDHVILGRATMHDRWRGLAELNATTHDRQLLTATAPRPWRNVRYVRVETRQSPSWVAWKEIAVFRAR
jgi:tricorn protease-like protein